MAEEVLMDELGLRCCHVALLLAPSSLHFPVVSLGVLTLSAVLSTANPLLTPGVTSRNFYKMLYSPKI